MANFISISGAAGSGKTTIATYLKWYFHNHYYTISDFSFAGPLKDALCGWFNWDRQRLDTDFAYKEGSTLDDGSPDPYCERLGMTRRCIMQVFGTECMRHGMHENFWIIMADVGVQLNKIPPSDIYVISDARFINELDWAKSLGGYRIMISRRERTRDDPTAYARSLTISTGHVSEQEFVGWPHFDEHIINLIDHNQPHTANMNNLKKHLDETTIPNIRKRFNLSEHGNHNWSLSEDE
jgi:hypothetical protein